MIPTIAYQPIAFGPDERRLFGIFHPAHPSTSPSRPAVVLCNAFGQEAIRAHRFQRTLAERLARAGHPVLRFDYFGTGDSMGSDIDGDIVGWILDLRAAHAEVRHLSNASRIVWIGMRLGATVALRAAQAAPSELTRLILWDPILDGSAYLAYLRERHVASLENVYSLPPIPSPRKQAEDPACYRDEAIGFALSPALRSQLSDLDWRTLDWPAMPNDVVVVTDPDSSEGRDLSAILKRDGFQATVIEARHGTNWTTDTAANTSLVPTVALMALAQQAGEAK